MSALKSLKMGASFPLGNSEPRPILLESGGGKQQQSLFLPTELLTEYLRLALCEKKGVELWDLFPVASYQEPILSILAAVSGLWEEPSLALPSSTPRTIGSWGSRDT